MKLLDFGLTRLTQEKVIKSFDCGDNDLNDFLFNDSKNYLKELLAVTYLIESENDTVAFFCVSNDLVSYHDNNRSIWNKICRRIPNTKRRKYYPAVKIGRLGVSKKYQRNGLGTQLLDIIKFLFIDNNKTGCRHIVLDAYNNDKTTSFYQKNDFKFLTNTDTSSDTRTMYYDLIQMVNRNQQQN